LRKKINISIEDQEKINRTGGKTDLLRDHQDDKMYQKTTLNYQINFEIEHKAHLTVKNKVL
jgi:hypothetical protein